MGLLSKVAANRSLRVVVLAVAGCIVVTAAFGVDLLRYAGTALVVEDELAAADAIAVMLDTGGAGAIEAADLVKAGVAARVVVFAAPLRAEAIELRRRGLPYEDAGTRQMAWLGQLGVVGTEQIGGPAGGGTHADATALVEWCRASRVRSIVVVTNRDHSRRVRRVMTRALDPVGVSVRVRPAAHSEFDPTRWWQSNDGRRIAIIEWQKLLLDLLAHPLPVSNRADTPDRAAGGRALAPAS